MSFHLRRPVAHSGLGLVVGLAFAALGIASSVQANDGVASMAGGGLSFGKSDVVQMEAESLVIDLDGPRIRLRYAFRNPSNDPVTLDVAFPLPIAPVEALLGYGDSKIQIDGNLTDAYVDFTTTINEQDHPTRRIIELVWDGEVIATEPLPENAPFGPAAKALYKAKAPVEDGQDPWSAIKDPEATGVRMTYLWQYTFYSTAYEDADPIIVEHSYTPILGAFVDSILDPLQYDMEDPNSEPPSPEDQEEWYGPHRRSRCLDAPRNREQVLQLIAFKASRPEDVNVFPRAVGFWGTQYLSYILTTANTWAGPIKDFKLVIKSSPNLRYVFCEEDYGIPSFAPGQVSYEVEGFIPKRELHIEMVDIFPHWEFDDARKAERALLTQTLQWTPQANAPEAYVCKLDVRGDNFLAARDKPSSSGQELARLHSGTYVQILESKKSWRLLRLPDGTEAWAFGKYLCS